MCERSAQIGATLRVLSETGDTAAAILAVPLAYLAMNQWLEDFAYRVEMSGWTFLISGLAALGVALVTVSYQALQAARANPADVLRYE